MKSFIEELYYGNIDPQDCGFEEDAGVQRKLRTISENEDRLIEYLAGEEKSASRTLPTPVRLITATPPRAGFLTGFRLGARFAPDTFVFPEASPQNGLQDKE